MQNVAENCFQIGSALPGTLVSCHKQALSTNSSASKTKTTLLIYSLCYLKNYVLKQLLFFKSFYELNANPKVIAQVWVV